MSLQADDHSPNAPAHAPRGLLRATVTGMLAVVLVIAAIGFVGFLSQLHGAETKPARHADGIVVLTGGSSRVSDAMELLTAPPSTPAATRRRRGAGCTNAASNR